MRRVPLILAVLMASLLPVWPCTGRGQVPPGFTVHAQIRGRGKVLNAIVAPGPTAGSKWIYASYINLGGQFDVVAVDPTTGDFRVFRSPVPSESGAWALTEGPDGRVYVGTLPSAHVMRLDWASQRLVDLGRPSPREQYIWSFTVGSDGRIYGGTAPNAKLISVDPRTGRMDDLGRMSDTQGYARYLAADDSGFVYVGIGVTQADLVAYDIATGQHRSILPAGEQGVGTVDVVRGADGAVYARWHGWLRLSGWKAVPCAPPTLESPPTVGDTRVTFQGSRLLGRGADGKAIELAGGYEGEPQDIFRVGAGPDGRVYGSTSMPLHLFSASAEDTTWVDIGEVGEGEIYSLSGWRNGVVGAAYSAPAPLMLFTPGRAWKPGASENDNPWLIHFVGESTTWRPMAMVATADRVYVGGLPGYGLLGSPLYALDPDSGTVQQYPLTEDQSVSALALLSDGDVVVGTTIDGGSGTHPTQHSAELLVWDAKRGQKVFETIPVPGQGTVQAIGVGRSGLVYGFAGDTVFAFDPATKAVRWKRDSGIGQVLPNSLGPGPSGALFGLTHQGVFTIDEGHRRVQMLATYPHGIDHGFAIVKDQVFFGSGSFLVSYRLPR